MLDSVETGVWLTRARARGFAVPMLAVTLLTVIGILLTARHA